MKIGPRYLERELTKNVLKKVIVSQKIKSKQND